MYDIYTYVHTYTLRLLWFSVGINEALALRPLPNLNKPHLTSSHLTWRYITWHKLLYSNLTCCLSAFTFWSVTAIYLSQTDALSVAWTFSSRTFFWLYSFVTEPFVSVGRQDSFELHLFFSVCWKTFPYWACSAINIRNRCENKISFGFRKY